LPRQDNVLKQLKSLSRRIGLDPLQVQGAGGNTSIKIDGNLWIKASGKWLANAEEDELFVPVSLSPLIMALNCDDPRAEKSTDFVVNDLNSSGLRPSIETTVHAVMDQSVVVHTHCVDTIALASQTDAPVMLAKILHNFNWLWVPYLRPGLPLSKYIKRHKQPETNVVILGNHGLVVAADTVGEASFLMEQVRACLKQTQRPQHKADTKVLEAYCSNSDYVIADDPKAHSIAFDHDSIDIAINGSLYPDHVIFLGDAMHCALPGETVADTANRIAKATSLLPTCFIVPEKGVLLKSEANPGQHAMVRCISEVTSRLSKSSKVNYLTDEHVYQLLNWEAEHYRQKLNSRT